MQQEVVEMIKFRLYGQLHTVRVDDLRQVLAQATE
jgi:hypothetical protein